MAYLLTAMMLGTTADAPLRHLSGAMALLLVAHHVDLRLVRRRGPDLVAPRWAKLGPGRAATGSGCCHCPEHAEHGRVHPRPWPGLALRRPGAVGMAAGLVTGTATAALAETVRGSSPRRATQVATAANMGGLGLGPLVAGLFAQFGPNPTVLVFEVYLELLAVAALGLVVLPESVAVRQRLTLRFTASGFRVGRGEFISAGVAVFGRSPSLASSPRWCRAS